MRVVIQGMSITEALEYKEVIGAVNGMEEINWLDDAINILEPLEMASQDTIDEWYQDGNALFSVTVNEDLKEEVVESVREIIGDDNYMSGTAVTNALAPVTTSNDVSKIMVIIVGIVLAVLLLTTTSWYEPVLFLVTIGIAIMLNRGTNLMFGTISFVTNAAGSVLQLAVSMDYSIFLLHRFSDNRKEGMVVEEAMVMAVKQSVSSILSSGLTTVTGFLALVLMRFKIGPDMGWVMAKAVVLSLICVLCLLPVLAVVTYKWIDATQHRSFLPSFEKFSKFVYKVRIPVVAIFFVLVIPCFLASKQNTFLFGSSQVYNTEQTQLGRDLIAIDEMYGTQNQVVLLVPKGEMDKEIALNDSLLKLTGVNSVISYVNSIGESIPEEFVPSATLSKLYSENYSRFVISLGTEEGQDGWCDLVDSVRDTAASYYGDDFYYAGDLVSTEDLKTTITADNVKVNAVAIGLVFLILLVAFKSISIPILLTVVIEASIWINLAVPYFSGDIQYYIAYLIISSVQLGATIDYAILLTERYKECRETMDKKPAMLATVKACTISIFTSAFILTCSGAALGLFSTNGVLSQLGTLIGRGAAISFVLVIFVLPILLILFDGIIGKTTIGWPGKKCREVE